MEQQNKVIKWIVIAGVFLVSTVVVTGYLVTRTAESSPASPPHAVSEAQTAANTATSYENKYFSFNYPKDWKLAELSPIESEGEIAKVRISSTPNDPSVGTTVFLFTVFDPSHSSAYFASGTIRSSIQHNDIRHLWEQPPTVNDGASGYTNLNGTDAYASVFGTDKIFHWADLYFLAQGRLVRVRIVPPSMKPLSITPTTDDLLSGLLKEPYGTILRSLHLDPGAPSGALTSPQATTTSAG